MTIVENVSNNTVEIIHLHRDWGLCKANVDVRD